MDKYDNGIQTHLAIDNYKFENVKEFTYLGSSINNENKIENEIKKRIMCGNRIYFSLSHLFKSKILSKRTKLKLYKTLIRPVVTYGAET